MMSNKISSGDRDVPSELSREEINGDPEKKAEGELWVEEQKKTGNVRLYMPDLTSCERS